MVYQKINWIKWESRQEYDRKNLKYYRGDSILYAINDMEITFGNNFRKQFVTDWIIDGFVSIEMLGSISKFYNENNEIGNKNLNK